MPVLTPRHIYVLQCALTGRMFVYADLLAESTHLVAEGLLEAEDEEGIGVALYATRKSATLAIAEGWVIHDPKGKYADYRLPDGEAWRRPPRPVPTIGRLLRRLTMRW